MMGEQLIDHIGVGFKKASLVSRVEGPPALFNSNIKENLEGMSSARNVLLDRI